jgi:hypothetical protein
MRRPALALVALLVACRPAVRGEAESSEQPVVHEQLVVAGTPEQPLTSVDVPPSVEPAPALESEPEPVADSAIVERTIVDPSVQAGLIEFADLLPDEGSLWIGKLDGNGGRDVVIYVPPGADDAEPFELVFHFHGTYSEHVEREAEGVEKKQWVGWNRLQQTLDAVRELQSQDAHRNVALVYPFSAGKRIEPTHKGWSNDMYDRMWMLPVDPPDPKYADSFDRLHAEALDVLQREFGVHPSKTKGAPILVEGHSAGGIALRNVALTTTLPIVEYLFLDAGFQSWADGCWAAIQSRGTGSRVTMVITNEGIADPLAGRDPWCVELEQDAATWTREQAWCETRMDRKPKGSEQTCEALAEAAGEWPDYEDWCREMKTDMQGVAGVAVVRTKVVHGDQPRRFGGGLGLPPDRD